MAVPYSTVSLGEKDQDSPVTVSLASKLDLNPVAIAERGSNAPLVVGSLNISHTAYSAAPANITALIPDDNTIPQSSEGVQIVTASITPLSATSDLVVEFVINIGATSWTSQATAALFRDSGVNAVYATGGFVSYGTAQMLGRFKVSAGSVAPTTFKVRVGRQGANSVYVNSIDGVNNSFGGVGISSLTVTEVIA